MGAVHSSSKCPFILYSKQNKHQAITMAPVEVDHVPRSIIAPVKNMKVMDKAMSLPLVSSAYSEVSRVTSPYMESTYNKVSPVVETTLGMVSPVVDSVKTKVEEQVIPHIPASLDVVDGALNKVGSEETGSVRAGVRMIHSTANTIRLDAVKKDGSEKAKKIEEASIVGAIIEVSGLQEFLAFFGFHLKTSEPATESDDAKKTKTSEPIKESVDVKKTKTSEPMKPSLDVKKTYVDVKKTAVNKTE